MKILKAIPNDHITLTSIMRKSKSYWGYSKKQILKWQDELTISKSQIINQHVYKLVTNNMVKGFYSFKKETSDTIKLDNLFILPDYIGKGFGKLLLYDCYSKALQYNFSKILLDADPNAENFYLKFGFTVIGKKNTSIKNRFMPIMIKEIQ